MTASAVLVPTAPSIGPGLKPNDRSLVWTSWISLRSRRTWLGVASATAGRFALPARLLASLLKPKLLGASGGSGDLGPGGSSIGSLFGCWLVVGSAEGITALGGGDNCADCLKSSASACSVLAADGHKSSIPGKLATPEPRTAPSAKPSNNL